MKLDRFLILLVLILVAAAGAFLLLSADDSEERRGLATTGTPFDKEDGPASDRRHEPERNLETLAPRSATDLAEGPAEVLPPALPEVLSRDDFGQREAALLVQVRGQDGEVLPEAEVTLHVCFQGSGPGLIRGDELGKKLSDEQGEARFEGLEVVSAFELFVRHQNHRRFRYSPIHLEPGEYRFQAVTLGPGLVLEGEITSADDGQTIAGAEVFVYDLGDQARDPEGALEAQGTSDSEGHYQIENLSSGSKRIVARATGLGGSTKPYFNLLPTAASCRVDFQLARGAAVSGQVLQPDGRPIAGASVKARPVAGQEAEVSSGFYAEVLTDSFGRYRIDGLLPGYYFLRAKKSGFAEGNFSAPGEARKTSMMNAQAGEVGINLYLGQGPIVRGRALDAETGEPIKVFDLYSDGAKDPVQLDPRKRQRVKDSRGQFEYSVPVLGSQARHIWLQARAPGYAGGRVLVDFSQGETGMGPLVKERDQIEILMEKGGELTGRILAAGAGLQGAKVLASRLRDAETVPNSILAHVPVPEVFLSASSAQSDAAGYFVLENLPAGRYRIEFQHQDYATLVYAEEILFGGQGRQDLGSQMLTKGATVHGQVVDSDGEAAEGAGVLLTSIDARLGLSFRSRTGMSGAFQFEHVPAGDYRLMVTERNGLDTRSALYREWKKTEPKVVEVAVIDGKSQRFTLAP